MEEPRRSICAVRIKVVAVTDSRFRNSAWSEVDSEQTGVNMIKLTIIAQGYV